jgi:hypothetical protein
MLLTNRASADDSELSFGRLYGVEVFILLGDMLLAGRVFEKA